MKWFRFILKGYKVEVEIVSAKLFHLRLLVFLFF